MARYRKEWTAPATGWKYRLDIVPYDGYLTDAVTMLSGAEANAIEVGEIETAFDKLPYGLQSPAQMTLRLVMSNLPAALINKLRDKLAFGTININTRSSTGLFKNTFLLFSDRGTNGATYTLEFVGTPSKINSMSYKKEAGAYVTSVELVDALYDAMVGMPMSNIDTTNDTPTDWGGNYHTVLYDVGFPSVARSDAYHTARVEDTGWSSGFYVESVADIMTVIKKKISNELVRQTCRTYNTSASAWENSADIFSNLADMFVTCAEFYQCADAYPRTASTPLTTATAKLVTRVIEKDTGDTVGGMVSTRDEVSWARYETAWDWYKDLCETLGAKVTYRPIYNEAGGSPYISYAWYARPVKGMYSIAQTASLDKALDYPEITETEDGIAKAEVRTDLFSDGNVSQWIVNSGVVRADQQFTLQCFLHNLPVTMDTVVKTSGGGDPDKSDIKSIGLFQTNRIVYESGGQCFLAHPTVKLYTGLGTSSLYQAIDPDTSDDLGTLPPNLIFDNTTQQQYTLWVNAVQTYGGLPYAIGQHVTSLFGQDSLASFEAEFRIDDYKAMTLPSGVTSPALGDVVDLSSSSAATELPHLAWSMGVITSVKCNHQAGTASVKFVLIP